MIHDKPPFQELVYTSKFVHKIAKIRYRNSFISGTIFRGWASGAGRTSKRGKIITNEIEEKYYLERRKEGRARRSAVYIKYVKRKKIVKRKS